MHDVGFKKANIISTKPSVEQSTAEILDIDICLTSTAKRARLLRKQVGRLRSDQAAPQVALFVLTEAREEKD